MNNPVKYKTPSFKTYLKKKVEEQIKICPRVLDKENIEKDDVEIA